VTHHTELYPIYFSDFSCDACLFPRTDQFCPHLSASRMYEAVTGVCRCEWKQQVSPTVNVAGHHCTCLTCRSRSRRGFLSVATSTASMLPTLRPVRVLGEWGDPERCQAPLPGDRIWDKISRKSSLKERARLASFPPRGFVLGVVLVSDSATQTCTSYTVLRGSSTK
jgi:hypothetical protein